MQRTIFPSTALHKSASSSASSEQDDSERDDCKEERKGTEINTEDFNWDSDTLAEVRSYILQGHSVDDILLFMTDTGIQANHIYKMISEGRLQEPKKSSSMQTLEKSQLIQSLENLTAMINTLPFGLKERNALVIDLQLDSAYQQSKASTDKVVQRHVQKVEEAERSYIKKLLDYILESTHLEQVRILFDIQPGQKYSREEIERKFRQLSLWFHPDKNQKFVEMGGKFQAVMARISDSRNHLIGEIEAFLSIEKSIQAGDALYKKIQSLPKDSTQYELCYERAYCHYIDARK